MPRSTLAIMALLLVALGCNNRLDPQGDGGAGGTGSGGSTGTGSGGAGGGGPCALDRTYSFGLDGGFRAGSDRASVGPGGSYQHDATIYFGPDGGTMRRCEPPLPACGTAGTITMATIAADLADADVRAAFAATNPPLFGVDTRPVDGSVYTVTRDDGHGVAVGRDCTPDDTGCRPTPVGVSNLVEDLKALDAQQLALPACAGVASGS